MPEQKDFFGHFFSRRKNVERFLAAREKSSSDPVVAEYPIEQTFQVSIGELLVTEKKRKVTVIWDTGSFTAVINSKDPLLLKNVQPPYASELYNYASHMFPFGSYDLCPAEVPPEFFCTQNAYMDGSQFVNVIAKTKFWLSETESKIGVASFVYFSSNNVVEKLDKERVVGVIGIAAYLDKNKPLHRIENENKNKNDDDNDYDYLDEQPAISPDIFQILNTKYRSVELRLEDLEEVETDDSDPVSIATVSADNRLFYQNMLFREKGRIEFGKSADSSYTSTELASDKLSFSSANFFGFEIGGQKVMENHFYYSNAPVVFDSGTSVLVLTSDLFDGFVIALINQAVRKYGFLTFNYTLFSDGIEFCFTEEFDLSFKVLMRDFAIKVDFRDLVFSYGTRMKKPMGCLAILRLDQQIVGPLSILGFPVFKKLDTVFDSEKGTLHFRNGKLCSEDFGVEYYQDGFVYSSKPNYLYFVDCFYFLLFLVVSFTQTFYRKERKDLYSELEENEQVPEPSSL